jgi:hypothetical protein
MYRKLIRDGITSVKAGRSPLGVFPEPTPAAGIQTYGQDTVVKVPRASTTAADKELLRAVGRRVAKGEISRKAGPA